jgi:hypothetical protein
MGSSHRGHTRDMPEQKVVTTADPNVVATSPTNKAVARSRDPGDRGAVGRNHISVLESPSGESGVSFYGLERALQTRIVTLFKFATTGRIRIPGPAGISEPRSNPLSVDWQIRQSR